MSLPVPTQRCSTSSWCRGCGAVAWFVGDSAAARRCYTAGWPRRRSGNGPPRPNAARQLVQAERVLIARELHGRGRPHPRGDHRPGRGGQGGDGQATGGGQRGTESIETMRRGRKRLGLLRDEQPVSAGPEPGAEADGLADLAEAAFSGTAVDLRVSGTDRQLSRRFGPVALPRRPGGTDPTSAPGAQVTGGPGRLGRTGPLGGRRRWRVCRVVGGQRGMAGLPGHGIVGMRERIVAFGGWSPSRSRRGFRVTAEVPVEGAV